jgi:hypothetical protein
MSQAYRSYFGFVFEESLIQISFVTPRFLDEQESKRMRSQRLKCELLHITWSPLWSSGQSCWLQIQRCRVRFPALPDFLSSSSRTEPTQPREDNWGATLMKTRGLRCINPKFTAVRTRWTDHATPCTRQSGDCSVGAVRFRTKEHGIF